MKDTQLEREAEHYAQKQFIPGKEREIAKYAYIAGARRSDLKPAKIIFITPFIISLMMLFFTTLTIINIHLSRTSDKIMLCIFCILSIFFISVGVANYKTYRKDKMLY